MNRTTKLLSMVAAFILVPSVASAQQINIGQLEYESNCAVCHGVSGKGDGPLAGMITEMVSDLTTLAENNDGVFPFNAVYETIDGRRMVTAHGTRDMPAWGYEYNDKAVDYYTDYRAPYDVESFIRGRVLALTTYIYELQAD